MEFICFNDWQQLPASSDNLFLQAEQDSMFFSRQWFHNLTDNGLENGQQLVLACVVKGDIVLAILPLIRDETKNCQSLSHKYTALCSLLLAADQQQNILECLIDGLTRLSCRSLRLEPLAEDDPNLSLLEQVMQSNGIPCHRYFRFYNWFHRCQGQSFTDYLSARPARLRNTIARKQRKLEREHGYSIQLFQGEQVPAAMADYHASYQASWKANEQYAGLIDGLATRFAEPGWTRLGILYIQQQPAAAQLWFVVHTKASIFRLAYDEAWKHYSPGSILTSYLMQHVIDQDRVNEIDFLTGNEAYKQDWMSQRRERWGMICDFRQHSSRKHSLSHRIARAVSAWIKPSN
ncbi:MAG: GNAT family N-acetyltransferase [Gammaproteobacteria bacterium]|nr:GNAT family N-acetyltransferase [Gammaproteobacteria bacterium]